MNGLIEPVVAAVTPFSAIAPSVATALNIAFFTPAIGRSSALFSPAIV
jgi:hypothetical protein